MEQFARIKRLPPYVFNIVNDLIASKETAWIIVPGKIYDVFGIDRMMKEVCWSAK